MLAYAVAYIIVKKYWKDVSLPTIVTFNISNCDTACLKFKFYIT